MNPVGTVVTATETSSLSLHEPSVFFKHYPMHRRNRGGKESAMMSDME